MEDNDEKEVSQVKEEKTGILGRLLSIYFSPSETFKGVKSWNPPWEWLIPFVVIALIAILSGIMVKDIAIKDTITRIERMENIPQERKAEIIEGIEEKSGTSFNLFLSPIFILASFVVIAGVLMFGGNIVLGGRSSFKNIFTITCYTGLIGVLESIVKIPLIISKQTINVQTSLALFLSPETSDSVLYRLMAKFDVFALWQIALLSIGLAILYNFSIKKTASVVVGAWIIWIAVSILFSTLLTGLIRA